MLSRKKFAGPTLRRNMRVAGRRRADLSSNLSMAFAAAFLLAAPAFAAPNEDGDNEPVSNNVLTTPVLYGRAWKVTGSLSSLADSNFRRTEIAESALRLTPVVDAGVGLPLGRQQLFFGGDFGRDYILGHSQFNTNRVGVGGGVAWRVGTRCSGVAGAEYRSRLNQVLEQAEFTDNVQNTTVYAGSATCQTSTGLGIGGSIRHQDIENERPERAPFNLRSTVYAPNIFYGNPTIGQFSLGATFNNTLYPDRFVPTAAGTVRDGISIFSGRVGYSRNFGSRIQLSLGGSYLKTKPKPDTQLAIDPATGQVIQVPRGGYSGGGFDVSLGYRASTRLSLNLSGSRNVRVSPNVGAQFILTQRFAADVNYDLSSRLSFGFGGSHLKNDYKQGFTSPDEPRLRVSDRLNRIYAQLDYTPVKLYSIGLIVAHQWRKANPSDFDYKSTTARLRLTVKFGRV